MRAYLLVFILFIVCGSSVVAASSTADDFPTTRDKFKWPFASNSIWNLPIGADAVYVHAGFNVPLYPGLAVDQDVIIFTPTAPVQPIYYSSAGWTFGASRCMPDAGDKVLLNVPLPTDFFLPSDGNNYGATILLSDNNTIVQTQPICRCNSSTHFTSMSPGMYDVLDGLGTWGAHGGSGLSAIGGTIRLGEIQPGVKIRHALKMNLDANKYCYRSPCFRYPATNCDGNYLTNYNGTVEAVKPGALLALPASLNISSLGFETVPAASLAWTLQNYGAYVVDDTFFYDVFGMEAELTPDGGVIQEFQATYNMSIFAQNNAFSRDMNKIYLQLAVVDNNNYDTIIAAQQSNGTLGTGGGAPRQPWAPPLPGTSYAPIPLATTSVFLNGTLAQGWKLNSAGNVSNATSIQFFGSGSLRLTTTASWESFIFGNTGGFDTTGYHYLHLVMKTGQPDLLCTSVTVYAGSWSSALPVAYLTKYGQGYANPTTWVTYNVPLDVLNVTSKVIQNVMVSDCSGAGANKTFYINQVQFTTAPYVNSTSTSPSTSSSSSTSTSATHSTSIAVSTSTSATSSAPYSTNSPISGTTTGHDSHAVVAVPAVWLVFMSILCMCL